MNYLFALGLQKKYGVLLLRKNIAYDLNGESYNHNYGPYLSNSGFLKSMLLFKRIVSPFCFRFIFYGFFTSKYPSICNQKGCNKVEDQTYNDYIICRLYPLYRISISIGIFYPIYSISRIKILNLRIISMEPIIPSDALLQS